MQSGTRLARLAPVPRESRPRRERCPLCGSSRVILTHRTESVWLWRCQRCSLQWPTLETERVDERSDDADRKS